MLLHKRCTSCKRDFLANIANFYAHQECKGGLDSACRDCRNAQRAAWKRRNKDAVASRRRELYAARYGDRARELEAARAKAYPVRVQAERLKNGVRERSKEIGFERPTELTKRQFFIDWLMRQPMCPCCGVTFAIGPKKGIIRDDAPSIDRFDPGQGYSLTNISLICWRCNNIKRNYTAADLRQVAAWMDAWGNETQKFEAAAA